MDYRRPLATLALALLVAAAPVPPLRELRWTDPALPRAERVRLLTSEAGECLVLPSDPAAASRIAIGRAVFASPLLLGGQAARAGISCAACHRGGRGNPHFVFPGVSGAPGSADVTSSLFSSRRGDGIVNPRPIPDLAAGPRKVDRDLAKPDLARFIRGLIVEEFDGLEPPPAVLAGLAAYVAVLGGACGGDAPRSAGGEAAAALAAVAAARAAIADPPTAHLLLAAARSSLGRLDERFAALPGLDRRLGARDAELRRIQMRVAADPTAAARELDRWNKRFGEDIAVLRAAEPQSLYAAAVLDRAVASALPPTPKPN